MSLPSCKPASPARVGSQQSPSDKFPKPAPSSRFECEGAGGETRRNPGGISVEPTGRSKWCRNPPAVTRIHHPPKGSPPSCSTARKGGRTCSIARKGGRGCRSPSYSQFTAGDGRPAFGPPPQKLILCRRGPRLILTAFRSLGTQDQALPVPWAWNRRVPLPLW